MIGLNFTVGTSSPRGLSTTPSAAPPNANGGTGSGMFRVFADDGEMKTGDGRAPKIERKKKRRKSEETSMFASLMSLVVEQQSADGAVSHPEFNVAPESVIIDGEKRTQLIVSIDATTPDRHRIQRADGRSAVVFHDTRGRATAGVLDELDDEQLVHIARSRNLNLESLNEAAGSDRTKIEKFIFSKMNKDDKMKKAGRLYIMFPDASLAKAANVKQYSTAFLDELSDEQLAAIAKVMGHSVDKKMANLEDIGRLSKAAFDASRAVDAKTGSHAAAAKAHQEALSSMAGRKDFPAAMKAHERLAKLHSSKITEASDVGKSPLEYASADATRRTRSTNPEVIRNAASAANNERTFGHLKTFTIGTYMHMKTQTWEGWFYPLDDQKNGGLSGLVSNQKSNGRFPKPVKGSITSAERRQWKVETPPDDVREKFEEHPAFVKKEKTEERAPEAKVHRASDMMDPTVKIFWVDAKEMTQEKFDAWLMSSGYRVRSTKSGSRYTAFVESRQLEAGEEV